MGVAAVQAEALRPAGEHQPVPADGSEDAPQCDRRHRVREDHLALGRERPTGDRPSWQGSGQLRINRQPHGERPGDGRSEAGLSKLPRILA